MNVEHKTKMKVKLLRQVKLAILAQPELYDQENPPFAGEPCETPCCIFGWLGWICDPKNYQSFGTAKMAELAGLTYPEFSRLYVAAEHWPEPFSTNYGRADSPRARALVAAARIEHFIATGGRE